MNLACSRLSDSGEDVKEKGMQKVGGPGKRKGEREPVIINFTLRPSSALFWYV